MFKEVKLVPINKLLLHKTDTAVKPIVGNRAIEKNPNITFNLKKFRFKTKLLQRVIEDIETNEIENHFADIYNYLGI